jgi:hypothetical protein
MVQSARTARAAPATVKLLGDAPVYAGVFRGVGDADRRLIVTSRAPSRCPVPARASSV